MTARKKRHAPAPRRKTRGSGSAREAYQARVDLAIPDGLSADNAYFPAVPAGRMLVIQFVSGAVFVPTGQSVNYEIFTSVDGNALGHVMHAGLAFNDGAADVFVVSQSVRLSCEAGAQPNLRVERNAVAGAVVASAILSGYLQDV